MFAQTKGSPQQREPARERLRDCKGVEFAGKKKSYSFHSVIRFHSSSFSFEQGGTKEKEAKRKCRKGDAQKGAF